MLHVPDEFEPSADELAVLSMLLVRDGAAWVLVAGSLLTLPIEVARMSWKRWRSWQPHASAPNGNLDLGPVFSVEPFAGVRAVRAVVDRDDWRPLLEQIDGGTVEAVTYRCKVEVTSSTSTVLLGQLGAGGPQAPVAGARRPVLGVVANLKSPALPNTDASWELATPPYMTPGNDLARAWTERHVLFWPEALLGIGWTGDPKLEPPHQFVIGRPQSSAWIDGLKADWDAEEITISIGWDARIIDPLACSLLIRAETEGLPILIRQLRISDLPSRSDAPVEPRTVSWRERTLDVGIALGPQGADWGVALLSPSGGLLDEHPVAPRVEKIVMAMHVNGAAEPSSTTVIGNTKPVSSHAERDEQVRAIIDVEQAARDAAAARRVSTVGELAAYLRWRFSCLDGELLLLDPGLFHQHGREEEVLQFLSGFNRPTRALVSGVHQSARTALASTSNIAAKGLPQGRKTLHDRIWIVGDTAVLVGASPGDFLADPAGAPRRATTATDLPHADAVRWRERFEEWWQ